MKEVTKENVLAILVVRGHNQDDAAKSVEAGYDLAVKAMPNSDACGIAEYVAWY